ncbi:MAG: hypothetical protein DRJ98_08060 [Thermoprotei archaeon]|nr:MAG: hypothetical protein DRJ98_08060 [Thermoprotei archaeon]
MGKIKFGATVSDGNIIPVKLSNQVVEKATNFWRERGLTIRQVGLDEGLQQATITAEGGTIWTTDFDKYMKRVRVSMTSLAEKVQVTVFMELPGAILSAKDKEKASRLMEAFWDTLSKASSI